MPQETLKKAPDVDNLSVTAGVSGLWWALTRPAPKDAGPARRRPRGDEAARWPQESHIHLSRDDFWAPDRRKLPRHPPCP